MFCIFFDAVAEDFDKERTFRGFPFPYFRGGGFVGVASDLSVVVGWCFGGRSPMSAL